MSLDALSASDLETGVPLLGEPVISQQHNLSLSGFVVGTPVLDGAPLGVDPGSLWPFRPNWQTEVVEEYEFNTDVFASRSNREQRRGLRDEPRKSWEFASLSSRDDYRASIASVTSRFDSLFYAVNPIYSAVLSAPFGQLEWVLTIADAPGWIEANAVITLTSGEVWRLYRVLSVNGDDVAVAGASDVDWPTGTRVRLAEPIHTGNLRIEAETDAVVTLRNQLAVDPVYTVYSGTSIAGPIFNGRELFLKKPNWREGVSLEFETGREVIDYAQGRTAHFSPVPFLDRNQRSTFLGRDVSEAEAVVNLFRRMKGQRGEFYMPTHLSDIVPAATLTSGTSTLRSAGRSFYTAFNSSALTDMATVYKAVIVFLRDGSYLTRLISGVTLSGDDSVFTLTAPWMSTIAVSDILKVSFLPVCRFATDKLSVEWSTNQVAQFILTTKALEAL